MDKFTVKQLKDAIKGQDSMVIRQTEFYKSIDFFKRDNYNDVATINRTVDFDNNQRFDWSCCPEQLQVLLSLPSKAEISFYLRLNGTEQLKEAGFNHYELMARIHIRKPNSDILSKMFDILIDTETSKIGSLGSQVKQY